MKTKQFLHVTIALVVFLLMGVQKVVALTKGDRVKTTTSPVMVRSITGGVVNSIEIGKITTVGTMGTIQDGPLVVAFIGKNITWYRVAWDTSPSLSGWSDEKVMDKVDIETVDYPGATWIAAGVNHFTQGSRSRNDVASIVIHTTEDASYGATISWFTGPSGETSSHYLVQRDGSVIQFVKEKNIAHHAGTPGISASWAWNEHSIGIEVERIANATEGISANQYNAVKQLVESIRTRFNIPLDFPSSTPISSPTVVVSGIVGHGKQVAYGVDPVKWDMAYFRTLIGGEQPSIIHSITFSPPSGSGKTPGSSLNLEVNVDLTPALPGYLQATITPTDGSGAPVVRGVNVPYASRGNRIIDVPLEIKSPPTIFQTVVQFRPGGTGPFQDTQAGDVSKVADQYIVNPMTVEITIQPNPSNGGKVIGTGWFLPGSTTQITATANTGWVFTGWNDGSLDNPRTITVPKSDTVYTANFQMDSTTINSISFSPPSRSGKAPGSILNLEVTVDLTPAVTGYLQATMVPIDGSSEPVVRGVIVSYALRGNRTIDVPLEIKSPPTTYQTLVQFRPGNNSPFHDVLPGDTFKYADPYIVNPISFEITASAGANGKISPSGTIIKNAGESVMFTAMPNSSSYSVDKWYLDDIQVQSGGATYTLANIKAPHNVSVTFNEVGDKDPPIILWQHANGDLVAWKMQGNQGKYQSLSPATISDKKWRIAGSGDINGDGKREIIWQHADGWLGMWTMNGLTGTYYPFIPDRIKDTQWHMVATLDINHDQQAEILWQHDNGDLIVWFMVGRNGYYKPLKPHNTGSSQWRIVGAGDFEGKGVPEILWQHNDGTLIVWEMDGVNMIRYRYLTPKNTGDPNWRVVATADYNEDEVTDIVWQHADGRVGIWWMNGLKGVWQEFTPSRVSDNNWHIVGPK